MLDALRRRAEVLFLLMMTEAKPLFEWLYRGNVFRKAIPVPYSTWLLSIRYPHEKTKMQAVSLGTYQFYFNKRLSRRRETARRLILFINVLPIIHSILDTILPITQCSVIYRVCLVFILNTEHWRLLHTCG